MPARRKRKHRSRAVRLLLAAALLAIVAWAVLPRDRARRSSHITHVAQSVPSPAVEIATTAPETVAPAALPSTEPSATPAVTPAPSPESSAPESSRVRVAIVIDDCGQWQSIERGYLALPIPLTLAVLPHVRYTGDIAREAAAAGKGVMLHLPMEPVSHIYPGPGEITTAMDDGAVTVQTEDDVAQVPLADGVNNHEGSSASADRRVMEDVMQVVKAHHLFFLDSRTSPRTVAADVARSQGVPAASRDVFLDDTASVAYTESMLERTVAIAKQNGSAIAIGHPKATTLAALTDMYPKMQAEGVDFVLASALTR